MATPERFDPIEELEAAELPLAEVIPLPGIDTAGQETGPVKPIETVVLPDGKAVNSSFIVLDGHMRNWLRQSVIARDMDPTQAVEVYRRWNPDPEFTIDDLYI